MHFQDERGTATPPHSGRRSAVAGIYSVKLSASGGHRDIFCYLIALSIYICRNNKTIAGVSGKNHSKKKSKTYPQHRNRPPGDLAERLPVTAFRLDTNRAGGKQPSRSDHKVDTERRCWARAAGTPPPSTTRSLVRRGGKSKSP